MNRASYWFQGEPSLWGDEQIRAHPLVLEALCELYREFDADVICVQKVPDGA